MVNICGRKEKKDAKAKRPEGETEKDRVRQGE